MKQLCFAVVAVNQWVADTELPARCCSVKLANDVSCFKETTFCFGLLLQGHVPKYWTSYVESVLKYDDIFMKSVG